MKHLLLIALLSAGSQAFATGAVAYNCVGKNSLNGEAVTFDVLFADHAPGHGYTNQSITILRRGWETLEKPIVLQMYDATEQNHCSVNSLGEINFDGKYFEMTPTAEGDIAPYKMSVKSQCAQAKLEIESYCFFQN